MFFVICLKISPFKCIRRKYDILLHIFSNFFNQIDMLIKWTVQGTRQGDSENGLKRPLSSSEFCMLHSR